MQPEMYETYDCPQCKNKLRLPPEMDAEDQAATVDMMRSGGKIAAMSCLREKFDLGLMESKIIMVHVSEPQDHCANCRNKLLESGITYCPSCSGLNLNW